MQREALYRCSCGDTTAEGYLLYFCDECYALRCDSCTIDEIVSIFCSACRREASEVDALTCAAGCARCPLCRSQTEIVRDEKYMLKCLHCSWQMGGLQRDFVREGRAREARAAEDECFASNLDNLQHAGSETLQLLQRHHSEGRYQARDDWVTQGLHDVVKAPLPPILRARRRKRCRACRTVLFFERKRQSALDTLPNITMKRLASTGVLVRLENPCFHDIQLTLSAATGVVRCASLLIGARGPTIDGTGASALAIVTCGYGGELATRERNAAEVVIDAVDDINAFISLRQDSGNKELGFWICSTSAVT